MFRGARKGKGEGNYAHEPGGLGVRVGHTQSRRAWHVGGTSCFLMLSLGTSPSSVSVYHSSP